MPSRVAPILRAQWRTVWRPGPAGRISGRFFAGLLWLAWYSAWAFAGLVAQGYAASTDLPALALHLPWVLMAVCVFWQLSPILTANLGAGVDVKRLRIYPIPDRELFAIEMLLRAFSGLEMILVASGLLVGMLRNPLLPHSGAAPAIVLFIAFNLFAAAGLRSLLERLLGIRRLRELIVLVTVLCAALPQILTRTGLPPGLRRAIMEQQHFVLPWTAAARLATGTAPLASAATLLAWTALACAFGTWQFGRALRFDAAGAAARPVRTSGRARLSDAFYGLPGLLFRDPLAALVEKELRSLARSPRFRLVFLMGFSFGIVIWWPWLRTGMLRGPAEIGYPVIVSAYALVLLAEVGFWNQFGFDRTAAQIYYSAPVRIATVLRAKNIAALAFAAVDVSLVLAVCIVLRVPLPALRVFDAYAVTLLLALYFLSAGNLSSVYHARPMDPEHSWGRTSAGRFQVYLLLLFPLFLAPVALAYLAAYAFDTRIAFYAVLAIDTLIGLAVYGIATSSAVSALDQRREEFLAALGQSTGPVVID